MDNKKIMTKINKHKDIITDPNVTKVTHKNFTDST